MPSCLTSVLSGLQVRNLQREVSRDADIVVAAMISIVGSTLIFQGWRLDPLLLLCQVGAAGLGRWTKQLSGNGSAWCSSAHAADVT